VTGEACVATVKVALPPEITFCATGAVRMSGAAGDGEVVDGDTVVGAAVVGVGPAEQ
jgi:hypothetical protein